MVEDKYVVDAEIKGKTPGLLMNSILATLQSPGNGYVLTQDLPSREVRGEGYNRLYVISKDGKEVGTLAYATQAFNQNPLGFMVKTEDPGLKRVLQKEGLTPVAVPTEDKKLVLR